MTLSSRLFTFGALLTLIAGCGDSGPKRNAVSGTVTFKNEPIKLGSISFRSVGDGAHVGTAEIKDGKYAILAQVGLPAAEYHVAVTYPDPKIPAPRPDEPPGVSTPVREMLPAKYNSQSTLKTPIKDGANDAVNFDLN